MIRRPAFLMGLLLGLVSIIQAGTAILTYFLTGKFPAVEIKDTAQGRRPVFKLISPDEVLEIIKDQAARGRIKFQFDQASSGSEQEGKDVG